MKIASVCYLPPSHVGNSQSFLANIRKFKRRFPLIFYGYQCPEPDAIQLKADPEFLKGNKQNRLALANAVFYTGVKIAAEQGYTHMIALETDCRVGRDYWDNVMWQEFEEQNPNALIGGSPVIFNPAAWSRQATEAYENFILRTHPRFCPVSVAGSGRLAEKQQTATFTNGALSIYNVDWLMKTFGDEMQPGRLVDLAIRSKAWDYEIGIRLWNQFDWKAYDQIVCLNSIYSGYGELMTTEAERRQWLSSGWIVAVHQIKSAWVGPDLTNEPCAVNATGLPTVEILIVSFKRDFEFVKYNLRSIKKFARGFSGTTIVIPSTDEELFQTLKPEFDFKLRAFVEEPKKGMLDHMVAICSADRFCESEYILHTDSDCIFTEPVTPSDYFQDGKPVLLCRPYSVVASIEPGHERWQAVASRALGFEVTHDYMVRHPAVHHRSIYPALRNFIRNVQNKPFREYVLSGSNEYPQGFCEFVTLGAYARKFHPDLYTFIDIGDKPEPPNKLFQGWSVEGLDCQITFKDGTKGTCRERFEKALA